MIAWASTVSCGSLSPVLALLLQPSASFISQASSCLVANVFLSSRVSFSYLNSHFLCFLWVSGRCHLSGRPSFFSKLEDFITLSVLWAPFSFPTSLQSTGFGTCWRLDVLWFVLLLSHMPSASRDAHLTDFPRLLEREPVCSHHITILLPLRSSVGSSP